MEGKELFVNGKAVSHWLDLPTLPNYTSVWAYVDDSAVQASPGSLDAPDDQEHTRLFGDPLQLLTSAISSLARRPAAVHLPIRSVAVDVAISMQVDLIRPDLPSYPLLACPRPVANRIPKVDGLLEVAQEFVPSAGVAVADHTPEVGAARVTAEEGLGEQE